MFLNTLTFTRPDDFHVHLRDGEILADVVAHTARQFARALVMPNLKPPVTTTALAAAYRERIVAALRNGTQPNLNNEPTKSAQAIFETTQSAQSFKPLMTLYLTNNTAPQEIERAKQSGFVVAAKLYPAGATTNSDAGVTDLKNIYPVLDAMQKHGLVLCVHGEVVDHRVDVFDREQVFIDQQLIPLRRDFPALRVVFEHITTQQAVEYVRQAEGEIAATITAHHLLYNRNAMFSGGMRPHYYCLPVLKREVHRQALLRAATSGNPRFFLGTDSAPHAKGAKEAACGCAGCYTALHALELYASAFELANALERLEGFASFFGADFYQLPRNTGTITLQRSTFAVPETLSLGDSTVVPLAAGEPLPWRFINQENPPN